MIKRTSTTLLLVMCGLLGLIFGTTIAYANDIQYNLSVGSADYTGTHKDANPALYYQYNQLQRLTMSADKTDVTFVTRFEDTNKSTTYTNGWANDTYFNFGPLYIYDEEGYHSVAYWNFYNYPVNNCNGFSGTSWFYGSLSASNNYVISQQWIYHYGSTFANPMDIYQTQ